jgi:hypothetical protein
MVFGRKKKVETPETNRSNIYSAQQIETNQKPFKMAARSNEQQYEDSIKEEIQPIEETEEEADSEEDMVEEESVEDEVEDELPVITRKKPVSKARIVYCEQLENGLKKYTFISNVSMGELGQEFNL